jgi:2-hydroxy-3-keto-5-methylthiopentenyl-1-phosphate phosphatase
MNQLVILCDFDGTITIEDTGVIALNQFSSGDWQYYDTLLEEGKITLEECIKSQFEMIQGQKSEILEYIEQNVSIRSHVLEFIDLCRQTNIPFVILSAGIDFIIEYIMDQYKFPKDIPVYCPRTSFLNNHLHVSFPKLNFDDSKNFKEDIVRKYNTEKNTCIYIGNGLSDFEGVRGADFSYVVKNSKLADLCKKENISHQDFSDFNQILKDVKLRYT